MKTLVTVIGSLMLVAGLVFANCGACPPGGLCASCAKAAATNAAAVVEGSTNTVDNAKSDKKPKKGDRKGKRHQQDEPKPTE